MQVESSTPSPVSNAEMTEDDDKIMDATTKEISMASIDAKITVDDLYLLCDLFYLPFEHGSRGFKLLNEFNWLKANAHVLLNNIPMNNVKKICKTMGDKPEVAEWFQRAASFSLLCDSVLELLKKIAHCTNKEICHDLYSYVWDITGALTMLNAFVKWLTLADFPHNIYTYIQGSYTWFSNGWKEAFMSGDQEPWVFRGGLIADCLTPNLHFSGLILSHQTTFKQGFEMLSFILKLLLIYSGEEISHILLTYLVFCNVFKCKLTPFPM